jgi:hypothetical protein
MFLQFSEKNPGSAGNAENRGNFSLCRCPAGCRKKYFQPECRMLKGLAHQQLSIEAGAGA